MAFHEQSGDCSSRQGPTSVDNKYLYVVEQTLEAKSEHGEAQTELKHPKDRVRLSSFTRGSFVSGLHPYRSEALLGQWSVSRKREYRHEGQGQGEAH
jgi:hypothetical protein